MRRLLFLLPLLLLAVLAVGVGTGCCPAATRSRCPRP